MTRFQAITDRVATVMARRLLVPRDRIDVVPRGRDPGRLGNRTVERREHARRLLGVAPSTPLILAACRQEHAKGLDVLLRAIACVRVDRPEVRLVVAGREGNESAALLGLVAELSLDESVRFVGDRRDVPDLMCAADVLALPSRREGFGSVLLEAMALGAPIVVSNLPPVREVLAPDEALFVPVGDPGELAGALDASIADREAAVSRAGRARAHFERAFTIDRIATQTLDMYERALTSRTHR